jgi:HKD family nuclease
MKALIYENDLLKHFRSELNSCDSFGIAMALISRNGLELIEGEIQQCLERGGQGRVLFGIDLATEPDAIARLLELKDCFPETLEVRLVGSREKSEFHVKFAVFHRSGRNKTAILGSANLSERGFTGNVEAGILIDHGPTIDELMAYFDIQFEGHRAEDVDSEWLERYTVEWGERTRLEQEGERVRQRVGHIRSKTNLKPVPKQIDGYVFAFTGKIPERPRESDLYPKVRKRGGRIIDRAEQVGQADCLVQGIIRGDQSETRKLRGARQCDIPIIGMEEFLKMLERRMNE